MHFAFKHSKPKATIPDSDNHLDMKDEAAAPAKEAAMDAKDEELSENPLEPELSRIDTSDFPGAFSLAMITVALMLSIFLCALDMTIIGTAIPRITDEFKSVDQVGWYGSAFFLTLAAFQSTWGKIYKYFPLKISYLISILIFEVGSLICAVSKNSTTLIVGRAIAGAGGAGIASGAFTIIAFSVVPAKRPAYTGLMGSIWAIASVVGPLLGGVFTDHLSWRWCFYINLPIGGLAAIFTFIFFNTPKAARPTPASAKEKLLQLDLQGSFIIMASLTCLFLALQQGGTTKPWSNGTVIAELVLFGVILIGFIINEYFSGDRALLQGRFLKDRTIGPMCAYMFVITGSAMLLMYYLPIYFQATRGDSAQESGIKNLPLVLGMSIFVMISGIFMTATRLYIPLMILGSTLATIACGLLYTLEINSGPGQWLGYQAMAGMGFGLTTQVPIIVVQSIVRPSDLSSASSVVLFFQCLGGAVWLSAGQAGWTNKMLKESVVLMPDMNPGIILATGASDLRNVFSAEQLSTVLEVYMAGLRLPFAIAIALAGLTVFLAFTPRWQKLPGDKSVTSAA